MNIATIAGFLLLTICFGFVLYNLQRSQKEGKAVSIPLWVPVGFYICVVILDITMPLGRAIGVAYVPLVFCSLWFRDRNAPFYFGLFSTLLTILGYFLSPAGTTASESVLFNRFLSVIAIWVTTTAIYLQKHTEDKSKEGHLRVKAILDTAVDAIITIDEVGIVESINPAAERLTGFTTEEVVGQNVKMLMPSPYAGEHDGYLKNYRTTGEKKIIGIGREVVVQRKDGSTFPAELAVSEMILGNRKMFTGILRDISERREIENALSKLSSELKLIFENAGEGIYGLDLNGQTTFANQAAVDILGYTLDEMLNVSQHDLVHYHYPDGSPYIKEDCNIYAALHDGKTHTEDKEVFWHKDGRPIPVEYTSRPIIENGQTTGAVVTFRDITERKRYKTKIEEGLLKNKAILDTAVDAIVTISEVGIVESINPAAERLTGFTTEEVVGQNVKMLMPSPYAGEHDGYLKNYRTTGEKKIIGIGREVVVQRKDGSTFPAELAVSEMVLGDRKMFTGILRDITERKQYEDKLLSSNKELEQFASVASHDLQEPLRKVSAYASCLQDDYSGLLDEDGQYYITEMGNATRRMKQLINDLLAYSRVTSKAKPFESVDLNKVAQEVISDLEVRIAEVGGTVELDDLPTIDAEPLQMRQLLQNLIGNGLKYHRPDVPPVVKIKSLPVTNGMVNIVIEDNGIGFEDEYAKSIFNIFQRLHGRNKYEGTGIGLAICRKIADRHGGSIVAQGIVNQRATFFIQLPQHQLQIATVESSERLVSIGT